MSGTRHPPLTLPTPTSVDAPFAAALEQAGDSHADLVVLAADLSRYTDVRGFADAHPDRFLQIGMAEQNLMGVAAGLSKTGLRPVITTYCVFATRRAYEQVALALGTGRRPAVIAAFLPGITTPFKATHQGTDDLALMRNIPGLTVIDPMDATDLSAALLAAADHDGPVYLRGLRGTVAQYLDPTSYRFRIGAVHQLRGGRDIGLISTGLGSQWALHAAEVLAGRGIHAAVLHVPTIKPVATQEIAAYCARFPVTVTIENHNRTGGLGTVVAEVIADTGVGTRLVRLGVPDAWAPAGSLDHIRVALRLDSDGIADAAANALSACLEGATA